MNMFRKRIALFLKGIGMGAADVIPGVSGGTIAFITGIYEELINTIKNVHPNLLKVWKKEGFGAFWNALNGNFLLVLFLGIGTSLLSLAHVVSFLLDNYPIYVWSFFFGLILASAWVVGKKVLRWSWNRFLFVGLGIVIAVWITLATPAQTPETMWFIFLSGTLAICAMILPGISGSFILLLLSKYEFIIQAIKDLDVKIIAIFGAGAVLGIMSFSRLLSWMFKKYHDLTVALLSGFMIGSLLKVWPYKKVVETRIDRHGEVVPLIEKAIFPDGEMYSTIPAAAALTLTAVILIIVLDRYAPEANES
jgi:putative membrane protein